MDLYLLNSDMSRDIIVENYESLVWAERYQDLGDFTLELPANTRWRSRLTPGRHLSYDGSLRVMSIETTEDKLTSAGERKFVASGRSIEKILDGRVAMHPTNPTWKREGIPGQTVRRIVDDICRLGTVNARDIIPGLELGTLFPPDTIPEEFEEITVEVEPESLLTFVKALCGAYDMGFRLCKHRTTNKLYFEVYTGRDLTSAAPIDNPVIFSTDLGNVEESTLLKTNAYYRTHVLVTSAQGRVWVDRGDGSQNGHGFNRNVVVVNNTEITEGWLSSRAQIQMQADGQAALAAGRKLTAFDGQISKIDSYEYGVDYNVGDVVELRSENAEISRMRVTEVILTNDAAGVHAYPTLTYLETATPGTWGALTGDDTWSDMTTETWATADSIGG